MKTGEKVKQHHYVENLGDIGGALSAYVEQGNLDIQRHELRQIVVEAETRFMTMSVTRDGDHISVRAAADDLEDASVSLLGRLFRNRETRAEVVIKVPADCLVSARVVTGSLAVADLQAPVQTKVVAGMTALQNLGGSIDARSTTGSLEYRGELAPEMHSFKVTTGRVDLMVSNDLDARIDLKTVTGRVNCELNGISKAHRKAVLPGERVRAILGSGRGSLRANAVTGTVSLRREPLADQDISKGMEERQ